MSVLFDTKELSKGMFPINFEIIDWCQWKYPGVMKKINPANIKSVIFVEKVFLNIS